MPLIEWSKAFEVGVPAVDFEHRQLVALINEGYQLYSDQGADQSTEFKVSEYLGEIYARISSHFALEEKEMKAVNYPEYDSHKEDHERLLDDIRDMMEIYENRGYFSEEELSQHLISWFTGHFGSHDALLHGRMAGASPRSSG